ncbi:hypothetical protein BS47DRAFT_1360944 [Hydnum rufescens UP504]|uniref:DUF6532 domain-containing protein n=1 Tax=Hydnum rufescens UP504 TaxID=1448309 RepID=A0A9P6DVM9_9AGAM|nr:hypothetical protein BS47DRAFT_1360944 [Hydnum rufescens UP504]
MPILNLKSTKKTLKKPVAISSSNTKPIPINPNNSEVPVITHRHCCQVIMKPLHHGPARQSHLDSDHELIMVSVAKHDVIMKRQAAEDEQCQIEDEELSFIPPSSSTAQRAPHVVQNQLKKKLGVRMMILQLGTVQRISLYIHTIFKGDHGHNPLEISSMDPMSEDDNRVMKSHINTPSDKNIDVISNGNSLRLSSPDPDLPSPGFLGESTGMSEYDLENSGPVGTGMSNIGDDFGAGNGDVFDDGNFGKSDPINFQQGYGHELLSWPPAKQASDFESNTEDVEILSAAKKPQLAIKSNPLLSMSSCTTEKKSSTMHLSQGIKPQLQAVGTDTQEELRSSNASLSCSGTPAGDKYASTNTNHQVIIKMTKSLYYLALITSNPWATMDPFEQIMGVHSQFHNQFKQAAQKHVPSFYGLINMSPASISAKVAVALANGNYHAKMFAVGKTQTGLYEHPCILAIINEGYFLNDKSEGAVHFASFTPWIPIPTIKAALSEYASGIYKPTEFSAKVWAPDYEAEVANWKFWASKDDAPVVTSHHILTSLSNLAAYYLPSLSIPHY